MAMMVNRGRKGRNDKYLLHLLCSSHCSRSIMHIMRSDNDVRELVFNEVVNLF